MNTPTAPSSILVATAHRPWPLPTGPWRMAMTWHDLLFAHWPVDVEKIRHILPPGLEVDTFDRRAWIGVVPFRMTGVRARRTLALPWLSAFPELNVRTYVNAHNKPGVYFFSLDAGNPIAVWTARTMYHLPYFRARMATGWLDDAIEYVSRRTHRGAAPAAFSGRYRPVGPEFHPAVGSMEHWLTERYCLYTADRRGRIYRGEIHHTPWPLHRAEAEIERNTMAEPIGLDLPRTPECLHFAERLDVLAWPLRPVNG